MNYETLFARPAGRTPRAQFVPALVTLLAAVLFFVWLVRNRTGDFCLLVLVYPGAMLLARRLHDMGRSASLLALPVLLLVAAFGIRLKYLSLGPSVDGVEPTVAVAIAAAFAAWGCLAPSRPGANRLDAPTPA